MVSSQAAALLRGRQRQGALGAIQGQLRLAQRQMRDTQVVLDFRHARQPLRGGQQQFASLNPLACVERTLGPV